MHMKSSAPSSSPIARPAPRRRPKIVYDGGPTFTITDLSREFDLTPRALRFYEAKELLNPIRRNGARAFTQRDRARLVLILRGKRIGLSLEEIRELLDLYDLEDGPRAQLQASKLKFEERRDALLRQRQDIETAIIEVEAGLELIARKLAEAGPSPQEEAAAQAFDRAARQSLGESG